MTETPRPPETASPTCYRHTDRETWIRCQRCDRPICPDCMHEASVGFQCPSCLREGARSTRSGRTAYGGKRSPNPALTSMVLIGVNVAVWLAITVTGGRASALIDWVALRTRGYCVADGSQGRYFPSISSSGTCAQIADTTWYQGVVNGAPWQVLTSAFTHVDVWHVALNMFGLWILGPQLEAALGRVRFLALYLLSALAGSVAVLYLSAPLGQTVGASGAIFGLMGALCVLAYKVGGTIRPLMGLLAINVVFTVLGSSFISWQGHLGGFLGGVLVAAILVYAPRARRTAWQAVGLTAVAVLLAAAAVLRALV